MCANFCTLNLIALVLHLKLNVSLTECLFAVFLKTNHQFDLLWIDCIELCANVICLQLTFHVVAIKLIINLCFEI